MDPTKVEPRLSRSKHLGSILVMALIFAGLFTGFYAPSVAAQGTVNVSIKNFSFNPGAVVVVIGVNNTVTWTNNDASIHTVTSTTVPQGAAPFDSGYLNTGNTFTYTFTTPGVYEYHCQLHPWMTGFVTVRQD